MPTFLSRFFLTLAGINLLAILLLPPSPLLAQTPRHGFKFSSDERANDNLIKMDDRFRWTKTVRVTTGSCAAGGCDVTVTWDVPFPGTTYAAICTVEQSLAGNETSLYVERIRTVAAGSIVVAVANLNASAQTGTLHCIAMYD